MRAYNNLGDLLDRRDRYEEAIELVQQALELARKAGDRRMEWMLMGELAYYLMRVGRWSESLELIAQVPRTTDGWAFAPLQLDGCALDPPQHRRDRRQPRRSHRGTADALPRLRVEGFGGRPGSVGLRAREGESAPRRGPLRGRARGERRRVEEPRGGRLGRRYGIKVALCEGLESALALGRFVMVEELLARIEAIPSGKRSPSLRAQAARFRARLAAARGEQARVEQWFKTAEAVFREHGLVFHLAVTELEHAEWLVAQGRAEDAEPLLAEARQIFERLEAAPWLERVTAAAAEPQAHVPA